MSQFIMHAGIEENELIPAKNESVLGDLGTSGRLGPIQGGDANLDQIAASSSLGWPGLKRIRMNMARCRGS